MTSVVPDANKLIGTTTDVPPKKSPGDEIDVKTEFKSAIDETLTTVCQVASISDVGQDDNKAKPQKGKKK